MSFPGHEAGKLNSWEFADLPGQRERRLARKNSCAVHAYVDFQHGPHAQACPAHCFADGNRLIDMVDAEDRISDATQLYQPTHFVRPDELVGNQEVSNS